MTTHHPSTAPDAQTTTPPQATRREWLGLGLLTLAIAALVMDVTVLHLATPQIAADFQPTPSQVLWIVDAYAFFIAGTMIPMGTLGDRFGRKRVMVIGAAGFVGASIAAAYAPNATALIVARCALGVAGGAIAPSTLALIRTMFPRPSEFAKAISLWSAGATIGALLGPVLGGFVLERFDWGAVFLIPVPMMALLALAGPRLLAEARDPNAEKLDARSIVLALGGTLLAVHGLKRLAQDGVEASAVLAALGGIALLVAFVARQRRIAYPLLDTTLFRQRAFAAAILIGVLGTMVMFATSFLGSQFFQLVLGLSPQVVGLALVPGVIAVMAGTLVSPRLADRLGEAKLAVAGYSAGALGLLLSAWAVTERELPAMILGNVLVGAGIGPVFPALTGLLMRNAPPDRAGAAAAVSHAKDEFGAALGIGLLGSLSVLLYRTSVRPAADGSVSASIADAIARGGEHAIAGQAAFASAFVGVLLVAAALMLGCAALASLTFPKAAVQAPPAFPTNGPKQTIITE